MYKLVLDTNVIISAILFGGKPRIFFEAILEGKCKNGISDPILEEVKNVLESNKFQFSSEITHEIIHELITISEFVNPSISVNVLEKDPDDNKVLECALGHSADYIITGDIHLLEIGEYQNIKILTSAEFLKEM